MATISSHGVKSFSLVSDDWIPVAYISGHKLVSLSRLFEDAADIQDVVLPPLERVAIMRLLICITHAALNGPKKSQDWLSCRDRIQPEVKAYLQKWCARLNLFGYHPFLQIANLQPASNTLPLDKLNLAWASGNNHTLFDHQALTGERKIPYSDLARCLLVIQCFHPGGLCSNVVWNGQKIEKSTNQAPCVESGALLSILIGSNLLDTIHLNLVPEDRLDKIPFGRPIWEFDPPPFPGSQKAEAFVRSYLGRLVPFSRAICIFPNNRGCVIGKGLEYPKLPESREPMATVVTKSTRGKKELCYLRAVHGQHPWRELHSVLMTGQVTKSGGPVSLLNLKELYQSDTDRIVNLWVGGLSADRAKLEEVQEYIFSFNLTFLGETALEIYRKGVDNARDQESALKYAADTYLARLGIAKEVKNKLMPRIMSAYWSLLDNHYRTLISTAEEGGKLDNWDMLCFKTAEKVYSELCPATTPRQIRAFIEGYRRLVRCKKKKE
jgi:CRISPR system Cascade subunit CasA